MGIWIRSQNKQTLVNSISVNIKENIIYVCTGCNTYNIGIYSSKEKAIKVLNMILYHIENQNNYFENLNAGTEYGGLIVTQKSEVFQMPLDEEVKV